jgi:hypothetical protein
MTHITKPRHSSFFCLFNLFSEFLIARFHLARTVSTVPDYGLDDQAIGVRSPAGAKDFPVTSVSRQALSLLYNGYQASFPRGKARPGRDADHSPPSSAEVMNE